MGSVPLIGRRLQDAVKAAQEEKVGANESRVQLYRDRDVGNLFSFAPSALRQPSVTLSLKPNKTMGSAFMLQSALNEKASAWEGRAVRAEQALRALRLKQQERQRETTRSLHFLTAEIELAKKKLEASFGELGLAFTYLSLRSRIQSWKPVMLHAKKLMKAQFKQAAELGIWVFIRPLRGWARVF